MTYTWTQSALNITSMKLLNNYTIDGSSLSGIVIQTTWNFIGADTTSSPVSALSGTFTGGTPFDPSMIALSAFTDYQDLTHDQVASWILNQIYTLPAYQPHIYDMIQTQINTQITSLTTVNPGNFPWGGSGSDGSSPSHSP